jgi:hypothetical protein
MPVCPRGHQSVATDYCDECGAPLSGAAPVAASPAAAPVAAPAGELCPECGTPRTGRFCEVDGHDFLGTPTVPPVPVPAAAPAPAPTAAPVANWRVVVSADRAYHTRMQTIAMPDAEPIPFPAFCPERRFTLPGQQVLIGRRSRSRGIEPEIDLTGPPEDAAVSHAHAMLVAVPEGWAVVDLDSANGTYVNEGADPIEANVPVPVGAGDRIHVGAWTTLTLRLDS